MLSNGSTRAEAPLDQTAGRKQTVGELLELLSLQKLEDVLETGGHDEGRFGVAPSDTNRHIPSGAGRSRIRSERTEGQHEIPFSGLGFLRWTRSPG
jgi:hypothetical protein